MKNPLKSKTVWGILTMVAPTIIDAARDGLLGPKASAAVQLGGAVLALWGRQTAKEPLKLLPGAGTTNVLTACLLSLSVVLGGCVNGQLTPTGKLAGRLGASLAVGALCDKKPEYAARIAEIAGQVRMGAESGALTTVDLAIAAASDAIHWEKLTLEEQGLVRDLLAAVADELKTRLGSLELPADRLVTVAEVAGWIETSARNRIPPR